MSTQFNTLKQKVAEYKEKVATLREDVKQERAENARLKGMLTQREQSYAELAGRYETLRECYTNLVNKIPSGRQQSSQPATGQAARPPPSILGPSTAPRESPPTPPRQRKRVTLAETNLPLTSAAPRFDDDASVSSRSSSVSIGEKARRLVRNADL